MARSSEREALREWARKGAEQRLVDLSTEAAAILRAFPELRNRDLGQPQIVGARPHGSLPSRSPAVKRTRRKGRTFTAAQRKAFGERMRKYWAERRKAGGPSKDGASPKTSARKRTGVAKTGGGRKGGRRSPQPGAPAQS
jgi:hypothetical protein